MKVADLFEGPVPELAIDSWPMVEWSSPKLSSSKTRPYMDSPPVPSPLVMSPPWHMNCGMILWNLEPFRCSCWPVW